MELDDVFDENDSEMAADEPGNVSEAEAVSTEKRRRGKCARYSEFTVRNITSFTVRIRTYAGFA